MKPLIYLPGPVTGASPDERHLWRKYIKLKFADKADFLNPLDFGDWNSKNPEEYNKIQFKCREAIEKCDAIIAKMPRPSIGTAIGTFLGWWLGKTIIVIGKKDDFPTLHYYADVIVEDEDEAVEWLENLLPPMIFPKPPLRTDSFEFKEIVNLVRLECIGYQHDPAICGLVIRDITTNLNGAISSNDEEMEWKHAEKILCETFTKFNLPIDRLRTLSETGYYDLESLQKKIMELEMKYGTECERNAQLKQEIYKLKLELESINSKPVKIEEEVVADSPASQLQQKGFQSIHLITSSKSSVDKLKQWLSTDHLTMSEDVIEYTEMQKYGKRTSSKPYLADILLYEHGHLRHFQDIEGNLTNKFKMKIEGRTITNIIRNLEENIGLIFSHEGKDESSTVEDS